MLPPPPAAASGGQHKRPRDRNSASSASSSTAVPISSLVDPTGNENNGDPKKRKGLALLSWSEQEWSLWKNCTPKVGDRVAETRFISSKVPLLTLYEFNYGDEIHAFTPDLLMESQRIGMLLPSLLIHFFILCIIAFD